MKNELIFGLFGALALTTLACNVDSSGASGADSNDDDASETDPDDDSHPNGDPSKPSASTSGSTCPEIVGCVVECDEADDACQQACYDAGSRSGQALVDELVACLDAARCGDDESCTREKCGSSIEACVADAATREQGTPTEDPAPTGSIPPELVGSWETIGVSSGLHFEFAADASTIHLAIFKVGMASCSSEISVASDGVSTVSGATLSYHRATGTQKSKSCGGDETSKELEPMVLSYTYELAKDDAGRRLLLLTTDATSYSLTEQ